MRRAKDFDPISPERRGGVYSARRRFLAVVVGAAAPIALSACAARPVCKSDEYYDVETRTCKTEGCFLTTACVDHVGLSDDCFELRALRGLRDCHMRRSARGTAMVELYKELAPIVLERIPASIREKVLSAAYARYILPSAILSSCGMPSFAEKIYIRGALVLVKTFAPDLLEDRKDALLAVFGGRARRALA